MLILNILELIQPSIKKHSLKDENDYWTLPKEGKIVLKVTRSELLNKNSEISLNEIDEKDIVEEK